MSLRTLLTASGLVLSMAGAASAQTLVYCSEGSPAGFDPALYTSGTTFDASSHPMPGAFGIGPCLPFMHYVSRGYGGGQKACGPLTAVGLE